MPPLLISIETAGPDGKARRLCCDDFTNRLTSAAVVRLLSISEGDRLDECEIARAEESLARERALALLAYRERSFHQLCKRLTDDGYPDALAISICTRFEELGLVDDERFAASFARTRAASGRGGRVILRELAVLGVSDELAGPAVAAAVGDESHAARAVLRGRTASTARERDKLMRLLLRRGFSLSAAYSAVASDGHEQDGCDTHPVS